jgi:hypothetical protein
MLLLLLVLIRLSRAPKTRLQTRHRLSPIQTEGTEGRLIPLPFSPNFRLDMFSSAQLLDLSVARYFFQMRLDSRRISLDFLLEILKPQNFPSISVKFP